MIRAVVLFALLWVPLTAGADVVHRATVIEIVDGDTLIIDPPFKDGNEIRLVGIQAPKLPLGRKNFVAWPLAEESKQALSQLTLGKEVALSFGGARRDRYARWLAHLHVLKGDMQVWVQGEMLKTGMARVYTFPDNRTHADKMYALEQYAREARSGIWDHPFYAIRNTDAETLSDLLGTFQLIEGRVVNAAKVKGTVYLNFSADWRSDFTIAIQKKYMKSFMGTGSDPADWSGRTVRVRGWLTKRNGPMIKATHPEQIELLDR